MEEFSFENCPGCGAGPKILKLRDHPQFHRLRPAVRKFAIQQLHGRMRGSDWFMKTYLYWHVQGYACAGKENKAILKDREIALRALFKEKLNMKVNQPIAGKRGNTNTGNVCERMMAQEEAFSEVTGVPLDLVRDFNTLMMSLCQSHYVDADKFEALCQSWLNRFHRSEIRWNQLSPTMHFRSVLIS